MLKRFAAVASTTALLVALPVGAAQADPKGDLFTLECDNGETYAITTPPAEADWTPGFVSDGTSVIRPVAFGDITFTATFPGEEPVTETQPAMTKPGRIPPNRELITCGFNETFTDGEGTFTVTGTVTGFLTGH
jgi:hypothetical protein